MTAEVIVDIAGSEVDRIFEYTAIEGVHPGCRVRVPFGGRVIDGYVMRLKEESEFDPSRLKPVAAVVDEALTPECLQLAEALAARYHCPKAQVLRLFLPAEMRRGQVREKQQTWVLPAGGEADISPRAKAQAAALCYLCQEGEAPLAELAAKFGRSAIGALIQKGVFRTEQRRTRRTPYTGAQGQAPSRALTPAQQAAVDTIARSNKAVQLLHGVTGSGKTEVYLTLIAKALAAGKSAVFLVPEISLTPQMLLQLRERFGAQAAILHSGLSAGEKFDEWWRLRTGEAKIAIGARSAVFAPVENVGVIIIDEEHDGSYRSETSPRYSTAEVAAFRAKYNGCKLVLGSATPSVDTYRRAETGEYELIRLPERINKKPLPEVIVADMRQEVRRGNAGAFSGALKDELESCLASGNQAIIFLNRRGFAKQMICEECGFVARCPDCSAAYTYHRKLGILTCHLCGAMISAYERCPQCGSDQIRYSGTGTEKVESMAFSVFKGARIARMDSDSMTRPSLYEEVLGRFRRGEIDILIGTQMIAKGLDFPNVTFVGVINADMGLFLPDFRASERTFQLLTQVAGRAGRGEHRGEVLIQTSNPFNSAITAAAEHDCDTLYADELPIREELKFPPYGHLLTLHFDGEDPSVIEQFARQLMTRIAPVLDPETEVTEPMPCPIERIKGRYRYQAVFRAGKLGRLKQALREECCRRHPKGISIYLDIDPVSML